MLYEDFNGCVMKVDKYVFADKNMFEDRDLL